MSLSALLPVGALASHVPVPAAEPAALGADPAIRSATVADAPAIHALIATHVAEGRLLVRTREEVAAHAGRFVVAIVDGRVAGCADLAPLGGGVAEVRSLVVHADARSRGVGRLLVEAIRGRAAAAGFHLLCAFTHAPAYFVQMGFSIVPHAWVPEKIETDCGTCAHFRGCGQYAVAMPLAAAGDAFVPLVSLHG